MRLSRPCLGRCHCTRWCHYSLPLDEYHGLGIGAKALRENIFGSSHSMLGQVCNLSQFYLGVLSDEHHTLSLTGPLETIFPSFPAIHIRNST